MADTTQRPQALNGNLLPLQQQGTISTTTALEYSQQNRLKEIASQVVSKDPGGLIAPGQGYLLENTSYLEFQNFLRDKLSRDIQKYNDQNLTTSPATSLNPYGVVREPWIFAVFEDVTDPNRLLTPAGQLDTNKTLIWKANPKSVSWQISQRGVESKNKSGTVLHIWRDRNRKTDYDDPKITIQFQSGSILPAAADETLTTGEPQERTSSGGINNFYQFLNLVDRAKIAPNGQANLIHILYRSRIFPSLILTGFFDPQMVVQFSDESQSPLTVNSWQATFTIYNTIPKLNDSVELLGIFQRDGLIPETKKK